jgi:hypothetical protein
VKVYPPWDRKKRKLFLRFLLGLGLIVAAFALFGPHEPVYQGKTVSCWIKEFRTYPISLGTNVGVSFGGTGRTLHRFGSNGIAPRLDDPPMEALRSLGTNAVPYLIKALKTRENYFTKSYSQLYWMTPGFLRKLGPTPVNARTVRANAAVALAGMGHTANSAVPALSEALIEALRQETLMIHFNEFFLALKAFPHATNRFDPLLEDLSRQSRHNDIIVVIETLHVKTAVAARTLAGILKTEIKLRREVVRLLESFEASASPAVDALVELLTDNDDEVRYGTTYALGAVGSAASNAVPALVRAVLNDPKDIVRAGARRALLKINPEAVLQAEAK